MCKREPHKHGIRHVKRRTLEQLLNPWILKKTTFDLMMFILNDNYIYTDDEYIIRRPPAMEMIQVSRKFTARCSPSKSTPFLVTRHLQSRLGIIDLRARCHSDKRGLQVGAGPLFASVGFVSVG